MTIEMVICVYVGFVFVILRLIVVWFDLVRMADQRQTRGRAAVIRDAPKEAHD